MFGQHSWPDICLCEILFPCILLFCGLECFYKFIIIRLPDPEDSAVGDTSSSSIEPSPALGYTNIACAIDPTYQRRVMRGELASPQTTLQSSSSSSTTSSGTAGLAPVSVGSPISPLPPPGIPRATELFMIFVQRFFFFCRILFDISFPTENNDLKLVLKVMVNFMPASVSLCDRGVLDAAVLL